MSTLFPQIFDQIYWDYYEIQFSSVMILALQV